MAETTNELTLKQLNMWTKYTREGRITRHETKKNQGGTENQNWRETQRREVKLETMVISDSFSTKIVNYLIQFLNIQYVLSKCFELH